MNNCFAERLNELMKKSGYKQTTLADKLGISQNTVSGYINGRLPDCGILCKIADLFSVSTDYLLGRATPEKEVETLGDIARIINSIAWVGKVATEEADDPQSGLPVGRITLTIDSVELAEYYRKRQEGQRVFNLLNDVKMAQEFLSAYDAQGLKELDEHDLLELT